MRNSAAMILGGPRKPLAATMPQRSPPLISKETLCSASPSPAKQQRHAQLLPAHTSLHNHAHAPTFCSRRAHVSKRYAANSRPLGIPRLAARSFTRRFGFDLAVPVAAASNKNKTENGCWMLGVGAVLLRGVDGAH